MSRNTSYPFVRATAALEAQRGECCACDKPATHYVRVAEDYMRGNDSDLYACVRHYDMANRNESRFFAHCHTKKRFLAQKAGAEAAP